MDPLLAGVYAGSAATIGLRSAAPTLAAALDRGAAASPTRSARAAAAARAVRCSARSTAATQVLLDELVGRADSAGCRRGRADGAPTSSGWRLRDDEGGALACRRGDPGRPGARGWRRIVAGVAPRTAAAARPDRGGVDGGGGAGGARRNAGAAAVRCAGGQRRTLARQGDHAVDRASGGRAATSNCCGCRSAGSAMTMARSIADDDLLSWAAHDLADGVRRRRRPGGLSWCTAGSTRCRSTGPGHGDLVAELRAGLPPSLAVAGAYLDGIGVPACVAAATQGGGDAWSRPAWHDRSHGHAWTTTLSTRRSAT